MTAALQREPDWLAAFHTSGRYLCPVCSPERTGPNRRDKTLTITQDAAGIRGYCHHCGVAGIRTYGYAESREKPRRDGGMGRMIAPEPRILQPPKLASVEALQDCVALTPLGGAYLEARGLSAATLAAYDVVSGRRRFRDAGSLGAVGFRYTSAQGKPYAIKWRSIEGRHWSADGGPATLWGPPARKGEALVLCEGEIDAMSVFQASGLVAKALPSGANDQVRADTRMVWMDLCYDELAAAGRVILCLDNDVAGRRMAAEIARRIGRGKCWQAALPEGHKDANEVLVKLGRDALARGIEQATAWPVEGICRPGDWAEEVLRLRRDGMPKGFSTGYPKLDPLFNLMGGMLYIVTGRPGAGKSTFIDNVMINVSKRLNWVWGICSFESPPEFHIPRLLALKEACRFEEIPEVAVQAGLDWLDEHFSMMTHDTMADIDSVIERAQIMVTRFGIKGLVIDPFNFLREEGREPDTEYVNQVVAKAKMFAQAYDVAVFFVAHPRKPATVVGQGWSPGGYDISGSAHFFNRADFGITLARAEGADQMEGDALIEVWKCRWSHLGGEGRAFLSFDRSRDWFYQQVTPTAWDDEQRQGMHRYYDGDREVPRLTDDRRDDPFA